MSCCALGCVRLLSSPPPLSGWPQYAQAFNVETWRRLGDDGRARLAALLPEGTPPEQVEQLLQTELFSCSPRCFGAPASRFWAAMQAGELTPEALAANRAAEVEYERAFMAKVCRASATDHLPLALGALVLLNCASRLPLRSSTELEASPRLGRIASAHRSSMRRAFPLPSAIARRPRCLLRCLLRCFAAPLLAAPSRLPAAHRPPLSRARQRRSHHDETVYRLHHLKRTWTPPAAVALPPTSRGKGAHASEQLLYSKQSGGLVRRSKSGGVGVPLGRPCLGDPRLLQPGGAQSAASGASAASAACAGGAASAPKGGGAGGREGGGAHAGRAPPPSAGRGCAGMRPAAPPPASGHAASAWPSAAVAAHAASQGFPSASYVSMHNASFSAAMAPGAAAAAALGLQGLGAEGMGRLPGHGMSPVSPASAAMRYQSLGPVAMPSTAMGVLPTCQNPAAVAAAALAAQGMHAVAGRPGMSPYGSPGGHGWPTEGRGAGGPHTASAAALADAMAAGGPALARAFGGGGGGAGAAHSPLPAPPAGVGAHSAVASPHSNGSRPHSNGSRPHGVGDVGGGGVGGVGGGDDDGEEDDASVCDALSAQGDAASDATAVDAVAFGGVGGVGGVGVGGVGGGCPAELQFFALVRDAILSVRQELAPAEYVRKQVAVQAQMMGA